MEWERATTPAADAGVRVVMLRTGVVLSKDGGALAKGRSVGVAVTMLTQLGLAVVAVLAATGRL